MVFGVWRVWVSLAKNAPRSGTRGCMGSTRARGERDGVLGDGWSAARWAMAEEERGGEKPSVEQRGGVRGREDRVSDTPRYARPRRHLATLKLWILNLFKNTGLLVFVSDILAYTSLL